MGIQASIAVFKPEAAIPVGGVIKTLDGASLKEALNALRWAGVSPEKIAGLDRETKATAALNQLTGKKVRLTYVDGRGVTKLEPVQGAMTPEEQDFHQASVLLSDALIFPNTQVKVGTRWTVNGSNFANLVDPTLLARTSGAVVLERVNDHIVQD